MFQASFTYEPSDTIWPATNLPPTFTRARARVRVAVLERDLRRTRDLGLKRPLNSSAELRKPRQSTIGLPWPPTKYRRGQVSAGH